MEIQPLKPRGPRFAKAYTAILRDPSLTPAQKAVWLVVKSYASAQGHCFPSIPRIAQNMGCDRKTVIRALAVLEQKRILTRAHENGRSNSYLLDDEHYARYLAKTSPKNGTATSPKNGPPSRSIKKIPKYDRNKHQLTQGAEEDESSLGAHRGNRQVIP